MSSVYLRDKPIDQRSAPSMSPTDALSHLFNSLWRMLLPTSVANEKPVARALERGDEFKHGPLSPEPLMPMMVWREFPMENAFVIAGAGNCPEQHGWEWRHRPKMSRATNRPRRITDLDEVAASKSVDAAPRFGHCIGSFQRSGRS